MGEISSSFVSIVPEAKGFGGKLSSQIGPGLDSAGSAGGKRFGSGLMGGLKGIAGPIAALFAVGSVVSFFKDANAEARESQKVGALTANVIKTTGGAAKITTGQVGDLTTAISNKTGVDDEAIQHGANLLLTFKNVRNEVGKGSDVFNRATAAAVDLSASGFGDVAGSSKMLGKALNDPIAGITALGRAGVTFTAGQKKQIEGMVKSGDLLGAQKIIMAEVESQVGGAAAASATAGEKAAVSWGNLKEQIGTGMLPIIDKVAGVFSTQVVPAISGFVKGMQDGTGAGGSFVGFLKGIWAAVQPIGTFVMGTVVPGIKALVAAFAAGGSDVTSGGFAGGMERIGLAARVVADFFTQKVVPAVMAIVTAIQGFVAVALPIVQAFVAGMMARIEPMMPTIQGIFATIADIITAALGLIKAVIERVTTVIAFVWKTWGTQIMDFIAGVWSKILVVIQAALTIIQGVIRTVTSVIKGDWSGAWNGIKQVLSGAWDLIKGVVDLGLTYIKGIISGAWALIKTGVGAAWGGIKSAISGAWDGIKTAVSTKAGEVVSTVAGLPAKITGALGNLSTLLRDKGRAVIQGLIDGIKSMVGNVGSAMGDVMGKIAAFLPGSPVKEGPLKVLNRGRAGAQIVSMLAGGIDSQRAALEASMTSLVSVPRSGSLDFASPSQRASAVAGTGSGATSADIAALGNRFAEALDRQARTIQTMQRQMAGA